jgi:hypothetical protein
MSKKHFSLLLVATLIVGAILLAVPKQTGNDRDSGSANLIPGLESMVNDVNWLRISAAGDRTVVTLQRNEEVWTVQEASGYRANWEVLKDLLSGLAQASVVESKTANPQYYDRLGVEDIGAQEAVGVMIRFSESSGLPAVIVGNDARGRSGQYVRLAKSAESALIDTRLVVPAERTSWLHTSIIDVSEAEVVEVNVTHPDGQAVSIARASADEENFQLQDIPDGREIKSDWSVNALAGALSDLSLDAVRLQGDLDFENSIRMSVLTADGLLVEASLLELPAAQEGGESEHWIVIEAGLYTTALGEGAEAVVDDGETRARAEAINERVKGWAYRISPYKFNAMNIRKEDLLSPTEES